jgi:hypothetical protein
MPIKLQLKINVVEQKHGKQRITIQFIISVACINYEPGLEG